MNLHCQLQVKEDTKQQNQVIFIKSGEFGLLEITSMRFLMFWLNLIDLNYKKDKKKGTLALMLLVKFYQKIKKRVHLLEMKINFLFDIFYL